MIATFQSNVRNHRVSAKMNVWLPKTVKELYTLADKCAQMEQGRKLPGEEDCIDVDSEDDDESTSQKKPKERSKNPRDKVVLIVEGSGTPSTYKIAKTEAPVKEVAAFADYRQAIAVQRPGKGDGSYCKIH